MYPQLLGFVTSYLAIPEERESSTQSIYISIPGQILIGSPWMLHPPLHQSLGPGEKSYHDWSGVGHMIIRVI